MHAQTHFPIDMRSMQLYLEHRILPMRAIGRKGAYIKISLYMAWNFSAIYALSSLSLPLSLSLSLYIGVRYKSYSPSILRQMKLIFA